MVERQIFATSAVETPPVSMLKDETYFLKDYRPPFKKFDPSRSMSKKDLNTNIFSPSRKESPKSRKIEIKGILNSEKIGTKWGSQFSIL